MILQLTSFHTIARTQEFQSVAQYHTYTVCGKDREVLHLCLAVAKKIVCMGTDVPIKTFNRNIIHHLCQKKCDEVIGSGMTIKPSPNLTLVKTGIR